MVRHQLSTKLSNLNILVLSWRKENSNVRALITELTISDYMESIADHAKKICEDLVYTVDAEVIRHS